MPTGYVLQLGYSLLSGSLWVRDRWYQGLTQAFSYPRGSPEIQKRLEVFLVRVGGGEGKEEGKLEVVTPGQM